ncbi:hypothetical protein AVEN_36697-1, partial [Araneus ventricosus]
MLESSTNFINSCFLKDGRKIMSRKYLEQMIEEIEFTNYQRYLQASLCPPMYSEFHNFFYSNRCDWLSRGCFSAPYWL